MEGRRVGAEGVGKGQSASAVRRQRQRPGDRRVRVAVRCGANKLLFGQLGPDQGPSASRQRPEPSFRRPAQHRSGCLSLLFVDGMTGCGWVRTVVLVVMQYSTQSIRAVPEYNLGYWVLEATELHARGLGSFPTGSRWCCARRTAHRWGGEAFETPKKKRPIILGKHACSLHIVCTRTVFTLTDR